MHQAVDSGVGQSVDKVAHDVRRRLLAAVSVARHAVGYDSRAKAAYALADALHVASLELESGDIHDVLGERSHASSMKKKTILENSVGRAYAMKREIGRNPAEYESPFSGPWNAYGYQNHKNLQDAIDWVRANDPEVIAAESSAEIVDGVALPKGWKYERLNDPVIIFALVIRERKRDGRPVVYISENRMNGAGGVYASAAGWTTSYTEFPTLWEAVAAAALCDGLAIGGIQK